MTLEELLNAQTAAGQRYASAVEEMHLALIDLGAIDAALASGAGGYDGRPDVRSFHDLPQNLNQARLAHPKYVPADVVVDWRDQIAERRNELLASF